ncbi:hypothetical protein [uncultured Campylobacter sp.]|uniref:hypothetical protein n=1 Tax=uncultured Campylobacter sp. TaxID=218934 RepID=UPI002612551B|nr:hypothetical protein [uncultured Campylobacter sp.]
MFLYIGDIFPYYTPFIPVVFAVVSYLNSAHTRFVHLTNRSIHYVNKGKITKSIKFDEISLIKLTATPLFGHIVPARNSAGIVFSFIVIAVAFAGFLQSLRGFIIFMMSETDFERVCRYMLKERQISPSKFQKQFVIFQ